MFEFMKYVGLAMNVFYQYKVIVGMKVPMNHDIL